MDVLRRYLKAEVALVSQLIAMLLTWAITGGYSEAELVQTLTAFASSLLVALVSNEPGPGPYPRSEKGGPR